MTLHDNGDLSLFNFYKEIFLGEIHFVNKPLKQLKVADPMFIIVYL